MRVVSPMPARGYRSLIVGLIAGYVFVAGIARPAIASDQIYFSSVTNIAQLLQQKIDAECPAGNCDPNTARIDIGIWLLSDEGWIKPAIRRAIARGVPIRMIGDVSMFIYDQGTTQSFFEFACDNVQIRLRYNPWWFPEVIHWKAALFKEQGIAVFGSANFTPFELAPFDDHDYDDESVLFADSPAIVGAILTRFDQMWHDALPYTEADHSMQGDPPYMLNWDDACANDPNGICQVQFPAYCPGHQAVNVNLTRLEPDRTIPPDLIFGQGSSPGSFNPRLIQEINATQPGGEIDLAVYRLSEPGITDALINRFQNGVTVRLIVDINQYGMPGGKVFPEFELTHYNIDRLWAAGITTMKFNNHPDAGGVTHIKTMVTPNYATNASSNYGVHWQRDIDYFAPYSADPNSVYQRLAGCLSSMYFDTPPTCVPVTGGPHFVPFTPFPADAPMLSTPNNGDSVSTTPTLVWNRAAWTYQYDVYLSEDDQSHFSRVAIVNHDVSETNPPIPTYSWTPSTPLDAGRTYYWQIVSRTYAGVLNYSAIRAFTTAGGGGLPPGWAQQDVGSTGLPGNASYSSSTGTFTISGAGNAIWTPPDGFQFVYEQLRLNADRTLIARVASEQNTDVFAKAGLLMYESIGNPNSRHVVIDVTPGGDVEFMRRTATGGQTEWLTSASQSLPPPVWLKLQYTHATSIVTASWSTDNVSWNVLGTTQTPMSDAADPSGVYFGLMVSSHNTGVLNTSTFNGVNVQ